MSAFEVGKVHIDALITAGLHGQYAGDHLRWFWPRFTVEDQREVSVSGLPFTSEGVELARSRHRELRRENAGLVGAMLVAENRRSVDFRYDEEEIEEPYLFTELQHHSIDPVLVLKAISCYRYQACESPDWEETEAAAFCDALEQHMIRQLPGYDNAPAWEISDPDVFVKNPAKRVAA